MLTKGEHRKNNVLLWSEIFQLAHKIRACLQKCAANMANELHKSNTKLFKTIHNSGNISPKEIIIVSK